MWLFAWTKSATFESERSWKKSCRMCGSPLSVGFIYRLGDWTTETKNSQLLTAY